MKIGITGANGFIGSHLCKKIKDPIVFKGNLLDFDAVKDFVKECDMIYHVAGKNREIEGVILKNNVLGTRNIIQSMIEQNHFPYLVFLSSTQIEWNSLSEYAISKKTEEDLIKSNLDNHQYCIYRIPNVYGPGCKPFYNSVISTFCYQIAIGEELTINDSDSTREFIFIDDLVSQITGEERRGRFVRVWGEVMSIGQVVSALLKEENITASESECINLQKTLEYYKRIHGIFPVHENETGSFQELAHDDDVEFAQLNILSINPGCTRGDHYHKEIHEWFCCIKGSCLLELVDVKSGKLSSIVLDSSKRKFYKIERFQNHKLVNRKNEICEILIITNRKFDKNNPDTFKMEIREYL